MNAVRYNQQENFYANIKGTNVYVDYINKRLKILDYQFISDDEIREIIDFSMLHDLGKIISYCRVKQLKQFRSCGFVIEGIINGYFQGEDAYCISCFLDTKRQIALKTEEEDSILRQCQNDDMVFPSWEKKTHTIRYAVEGDIPQMIKLFSTVFETYPSPVFSKDYLKKEMYDHTLYMVAEENGEIISIAAAEMDKWNLNAEITDCVTYPEHRGKGILPDIIHSLEAELMGKEFRIAYSLARAINPGINKALHKLKYRYSGRLVNNCHICGGFEDMNVWAKRLLK